MEKAQDADFVGSIREAEDELRRIGFGGMGRVTLRLLIAMAKFQLALYRAQQ